MDSISKKNALIKNSKSESYCFHVINKNTVICDYFNDKGEYIKSLPVTDENVQDYDVDIDDNDIIHLLCLTNTGDLVYYIYRNKLWSNHVLSKLDVKSNRYRNLTLKVVRNKVHIFYSVSNLLNHNLWTIEHVVSGKHKWSKNNVISITPGKSSDPYYVSFDRVGGIHLVYTDFDKGKHHVYYTTFNPFLQRWIKSPEKISDGLSNSYSPFLFIDNYSSIHVVYTTEVNSITRLTYKQKSQLTNSKHTWKKYKLPQIYVNCSNPIIIKDNGLLKMLYNQDGLLKYFYSNNNGLTWGADRSLDNIDFTNLDIIRFSSNYSYDKFKMKADYIYGNSKGKIQLHYCDSYSKSKKTTAPRASSNSYYDLDKNNDTDICLKDNKSEERIIKSSAKHLDKSHYYQHNLNQATEEDIINNHIENDSVEYNTEPLVNKDDILSKHNDDSTLKQIEDIVDADIKEFIKNTRDGLDSLYSNTSLLNEKASEIEKVILNNIKKLDKKILSNKEFAEEIRKCLSSLDKALSKSEANNKDISHLLSSIEEIYDNNTTQIKSIQTKIKQVYDIIENSTTPSFFSKIFNIFK